MGIALNAYDIRYEAYKSEIEEKARKEGQDGYYALGPAEWIFNAFCEDHNCTPERPCFEDLLDKTQETDFELYLIIFTMADNYLRYLETEGKL